MWIPQKRLSKFMSRISISTPKLFAACSAVLWSLFFQFDGVNDRNTLVRHLPAVGILFLNRVFFLRLKTLIIHDSQKIVPHERTVCF